jgi:hypothetical protein
MSRSHLLTRTVAGALAVTALAAPAAGALPNEQLAAPAAQDRASSSSPRPTVTRTIDDGFDLGSAAIGAGGAAAVLLLSAAGASAATHRHHRVGVAG